MHGGGREEGPLGRFVAGTPLAAAVVDASGFVLAVNERMEELLGHPIGSLLATDGLALVHPDDLDSVANTLAELVTGASAPSLTIDFRCLRADGEAVLFGWSATSLLDDPDIAGILLVARQPGSEMPVDAVRAAYFEAVVNTSLDFVQVIDRDGRVLYASPVVTEITGYQEQELVGRTLADLAPERLRPAIQEWVAKLAATPGRHAPMTNVAFRRDGEPFALEIRATNLLDHPTVRGIVLLSRDVTEQRHAEAASRVASRLVTESPVAIIATDAPGAITAWNREAERILGWTEAEVLGRRFRDLGGHTAESFQGMLEGYPTALKGGRYEAEIEVRNRDGEPVPAYIIVAGLLDPEGVFAGLLVFGLDLREQRATRAQLASVEAHWSALTRQTAEVMVIVTTDGLITYAGPGFRGVLGYDPDALEGTQLRDLLHEDDRRRPGGLEDLAAERGDSFVRTYRVRHSDGSWRVMEAEVTNLLEDPLIAGFIVNARDVTDRVAAEEADRRYAELVESAGAAVITSTFEGKVLSWNPGAERLFGWTEAEAMAAETPLTDPPESRDDNALTYEAVRKGRTVSFETVRQHRDGHLVDLLVTASPVHDTGGKIVAASFIILDISDRRRVERERELRAAEQTVVAELGQRALAGASIDDLLAEACERVAATLDVAAVELLELDPSGNRAQVVGVGGTNASSVGGFAVIAPGKWLDAAHRAGGPLAFDDSETTDDIPFSLRQQFADLGVRSGAICVVHGRDRPWGFLAARHTAPRTWSAADLSFLEAVVGLLGTALERSRVSEELRHRALHDDLTQLPNRALLVDRLRQALARTTRRDTRLALLFVDLDRFKRVNDTLGHRCGDQVLVTAAARLLLAVRAGDTVARVGGDEFLLLCEEVVDAEEALAVADRVTVALAEAVTVDEHDVVVTASIGVAIAGPGDEAESVVRDADLAMYRAKQRGRSRVELFDDALRDEVLERLEIEEALRRGLASGEIHVLYQPQVELVSGRVQCVEALVRWKHPTWGLVPPPKFLPVAEEVGLLDDIGALVLGEACQTVACLRQLIPDLSVSVNLSPRQLEGPHVVDDVQAALNAHDLPASALVVEITETAVFDERTPVVATLQKLRGIGVRVSLDDFGTGYSSLSHLTRVPLDEVKVDRTFIEEVVTDRGHAAIVEAVVALARQLDLRVVAEGVERDDQHRRLIELGCGAGQGWLWTVALPRDELAAWLAARL